MARPAFGARWPWLTRRRVACVAVLLLGAGIAIPWNHRASERGFLRQMEAALPLSVSLSADVLGDWVAMHVSQARTLAAIASRRADAGTPSAATVLGPMLPAIAREGGYVEARVERLPPAGPQPQVPDAVVPQRGDAMAYAEFGAVIGDPATARERIVLRAALSESTLAHFNIAAADDRTQRTLLLLRAVRVSPDARAESRATAEPMTLLVASDAGGAHRPSTTSLARGIAATDVRRARYASERTVRAAPHGVGPGITGREVVYATAAVPGTPWLLVRERETAEIATRIAPALYLTDAVYAVVVLLITGVLLLRWRAQYQRTEMEAASLRATFVASVSHELRTPLTQVRMYAEMLRLGLLTTADDQARALGVIEKEAERLGQLIERALTFVRTGQAAPAALEHPTLLADAVLRAIEAIAPLAAERHVTVQHDVDPSLTAWIARDDLQQVLLNLLDNAIKYGPAGQVVQVHAMARGDEAVLVVQDQGPGVPAAERSTIWEPYRRGHAARATEAGGTGIGLVVVKALVERVGGRVFVRDAALPDATRSAGAEFVVELPAGV